MVDSKKDLFITVFIIFIIFGAVIYESYYDEDKITGDASWKKLRKKVQAEVRRTEKKVSAEVNRVDDNAKKAAEKVQAEVGRTDDNVKEVGKKIDKEVNRVDDNLKEARDKVSAEAGRFGKRVSAEWQRFDQNVGDELERFGDRAENEFNRIDDNLKDLADAPKEELNRIKKKLKEEVEKQQAVFKALAKGKVCEAYRQGVTSDIYGSKIKEMISKLASELKALIRPHVYNIVITIASPLNAIPIVGNAMYAAIVAVAPDALTDMAVKKAVKELLEECD